MSKRLTDNINSLYVEAANKLRSKNEKRKIVAYVESYDDIAFWRSVLDEVEDEHCYFQIMLPSQHRLVKGKKPVLMNKLGVGQLGKNMIACIDSDYDYALQSATPLSTYINTNPYVFQTYVYAIENYQCYSSSLHAACVQATMNDRFVIDYDRLLKAYSQAIYPLYVWSIWFYRHDDLNTLSITKLNAIIHLDHIDIAHLENAIVALEKRVRKKLQALENENPDILPQLTPLKSELTSLGITPDNAYLFIQGHHLMENVVLKFLVPICSKLRHEREQEIQRLAEHTTHYRNELAGYKNRQISIETVLSKHTNFKECVFFQKMLKELQVFVSKV